MREKAYELKKEIVIMQDFLEHENIDSEPEELENTKREFDEIFNNLSDNDRQWVNSNFFKWIELYMDKCSSGCSACSGSCPT